MSPIYLSTYISFILHSYLPIYLSSYQSIYLSCYLNTTYLCIYYILSIYLSIVRHVDNAYVNTHFKTYICRQQQIFRPIIEFRKNVVLRIRGRLGRFCKVVSYRHLNFINQKSLTSI